MVKDWRFSKPLPTKTRHFAPLGLLASAALCLSGCSSLATVMHAVGVDQIPADYKGLRDSTVAVITITDSSQYSNDIASRELSRFVGGILTREVRGIQLVREDKIEQWRDVNGWDSLDFDTIGQEVGAEKVLGIEVANLRLREGSTLYRGRADVVINVIDAETGNVEYTRSLDEFTYPNVAGQYTSETTESKFRKLYLSMLAEEISRSFHPYDLTDRIAADSRIASQ
jgi:hypothetical protein